LLAAHVSAAWATVDPPPLLCPNMGNSTLKPFGDPNNNYKMNLKVVGVCDVTTDPNQMGPLKYYFHNVNIVNGGVLKFHDDYDIDFFAESIVVENGGKLTATSTQMGFLPQTSQLTGVLPFQKRLTIHLWGAPNDAGIECESTPGPNNAPCGIPNNIPEGGTKGLWDSNPIMAMDLMMNPPPPPPQPKNAPCVVITGLLPMNDCFYQYEVQDAADRGAGRKAYFGHKVLAVSYGGTLQLFGSKGVSYLTQGQKCTPADPTNECNPAFTGTSWARLTGASDATHISISAAVDWAMNDVLVVTPTDYLPSHAEEVTVQSVTVDRERNRSFITLQSPGLKYNHNASTFPFPSDMPANVGPQDDPNLPNLHREADTRAAVGLLTRNIQIVSEGNVPSQPFTEAPGTYYGGHTIMRQGVASIQVQGVEFYLLGQGGAKGRYPVHFHMLRKVAQPVPSGSDPTPEPLNYLKDCSIHDSMTRWVTVHATEGMYIARNVGEKSIGHGYYLEDAAEINNKFYSNLGVLARAAIMDTMHNPRQVPGILADNSPNMPPQRNLDYMPYRSDYNHPSVFWITNGWNDFEYNFAASGATCGACYWWLATGNSGPSQYQTFDSYASQQVVTDRDTNYGRAGLSPLQKFVGNSCVAAMSSFQMNGQTAGCNGVNPPGAGTKLTAVKSTAPAGPDGTNLPAQPFQIYYPVITELHNPSFCSNSDCSANSANTTNSPCTSSDFFGNCAVTHLDHYTTSFNYSQTNFAAVWLRKGWDLVTNSAVTDVQTGGLNFITGGGYTRSDVSLGEWLLARNTVLIGHTQDPAQNPYALDVGPFNPTSGLQCDNTTGSDRCEYGDGGVSFNLPPYPGQKLVNIYDGPSHQERNGFLNITASPISDCNWSMTSGNCNTSTIPLARNVGVLHNQVTGTFDTIPNNGCYLPNAAIAWKQPNGFYYPPAFHSNNLYFSDVDIRHFVVEPLFEPIKFSDYDPFVQNQDATTNRYCTRADDMFSQFNHIDRQTVLNDDDGTLTGLVGKFGGVDRPAISINEDPFFLAPLTTPECLSDINVKPPLPLPANVVPTATTSPYEWLSTALLPDCAQTMCLDTNDNLGHWALDCTTQACRGVPLYREYLTTDEVNNNTRPQIRMMGQATGQRSTLSLNRAHYYLDTSQTCTSQGQCPKCLKIENGVCTMWGPINFNPSTFLAGHTYYMYLLYATATTKQQYDIYVGTGATQGNLNVAAVWVNPNGNQISNPTDGSYIVPDYTKLDQGILRVTMDLTGQGPAFNNSKQFFCRPKSYCSVNNGVCGCNPANKDCDPAANDCKWGPNDIDCPVDPGNPDLVRCLGFKFTLPPTFMTSGPVMPPDNLFGNFTQDSYFKAGTVTFDNGLSISPNDACVYNPVPMQMDTAH
jgi:hypothetical protein